MSGLLRYFGAKIGWRMIQYAVSLAKEEEDVRVVHRRAELLGRMALPLFRSSREVVLSNLRLTFPDCTTGQAERVLSEAVRQLCRGFIDLYRWAAWPELLYRRMRVEGEEHLEEAIAGGRGAFLATGHVGVFPFVGAPVMWRGLPFGTAARPLENQRIWDLLLSWRNERGLVNLPADEPRTFLKRMTKILKAGGGVMYAFDIRPDEHVSVEVTFMGQKTRMFSAMVRMAAKARAPLLPCYCVRETDGFHHRIVYDPPFEVPREAGEPDSPVTAEIVQGLADWLSDVIRRYPTQWWWVRRHWEQGTP